EEGDAPAHEDHLPERLVAEAQVAVPGEGHEDVRDDEEEESPHDVSGQTPAIHDRRGGSGRDGGLVSAAHRALGCPCAREAPLTLRTATAVAVRVVASAPAHRFVDNP